MDIQPSLKNSAARRFASVTFDNTSERRVLDSALPPLTSVEAIGSHFRLLAGYVEPPYPVIVDIPYRSLGAAFVGLITQETYSTPDAPHSLPDYDIFMAAREDVIRALSQHFAELSETTLQQYL